VVTVCRIYQRTKDQSYWDITLPDGSRAFVPDSWTESTGSHPASASQELALSALLNLATIVAELQDRFCQKGAERDEPSGMEPVPGRKPAAVDPVAGRIQPETPVSSCGEPT
jgi:hypothetical protein